MISGVCHQDEDLTKLLSLFVLVNELKLAAKVFNMKEELWLVGVNLPEKNFLESQNKKLFYSKFLSLAESVRRNNLCVSVPARLAAHPHTPWLSILHIVSFICLIPGAAFCRLTPGIIHFCSVGKKSDRNSHKKRSVYFRMEEGILKALERVVAHLKS